MGWEPEHGRSLDAVQRCLDLIRRRIVTGSLTIHKDPPAKEEWEQFNGKPKYKIS